MAGYLFLNGACMAASDKPFHNQRTLDIVFAVSNILMLLSIVWMMCQDYYREYKVEQRLFRTVEVAMAQRSALDSMPDQKEFDDAEAEVKKWHDFRNKEENAKALSDARAASIALRADKERAETSFQGVKADIDSYTSLIAIAVEHGDGKLAEKYEGLLKERNAQLVDVQKTRDDVAAKM